METHSGPRESQMQVTRWRVVAKMPLLREPFVDWFTARDAADAIAQWREVAAEIGLPDADKAEVMASRPMDPRIPTDAEALRAELVKAFPDCGRYLYPAVDYWQKTFAERHCWQSGAERGCWLAHAQMAWTNDSWGWQSAEPNAKQQQVMRCVPCALGGWFTYDVASIGD